jgi:hypothetical protein
MLKTDIALYCSYLEYDCGIMSIDGQQPTQIFKQYMVPIDYREEIRNTPAGRFPKQMLHVKTIPWGRFFPSILTINNFIYYL